jgi:zinc protease
VSEQELSDSIGNLVGSQVLRMETSDSLARMVRAIAFYDLPLDYPARYRDEIQAVTREQVQELAQRYLGEREPVIAIAGPPLPGE